MDPIRLFSYGTLQQASVQKATFGRVLSGRADAVVGFRVETLTITDPVVIETSGSDQHPILLPDEEGGAHVEGTVFEISAADLAAADVYEVDNYSRIEVPLRDGGTAWVYVFGDSGVQDASYPSGA